MHHGRPAARQATTACVLAPPRSGELTFGRDCTVNVSTIVRGRVTAGDAVRIGAHTSILGFNHSFAPGVEIFRQPPTSVGIRLGDDVRVGSHVVILDGVTAGKAP